jgi:hypothetical protein
MSHSEPGARLRADEESSASRERALVYLRGVATGGGPRVPSVPVFSRWSSVFSPRSLRHWSDHGVRSGTLTPFMPWMPLSTLAERRSSRDADGADLADRAESAQHEFTWCCSSGQLKGNGLGTPMRPNAVPLIQRPWCDATALTWDTLCAICPICPICVSLVFADEPVQVEPKPNRSLATPTTGRRTFSSSCS